MRLIENALKHFSADHCDVEVFRNRIRDAIAPVNDFCWVLTSRSSIEYNQPFAWFSSTCSYVMKNRNSFDAVESDRYC